MFAYDRLRRIVWFSFHQLGFFGHRWWHGVGSFLLIVGCFSTAAYLGNEYFPQTGAELMVRDSDPNTQVTLQCAASEYCRFRSRTIDELAASSAPLFEELRVGEELSLRANSTVWQVELLTVSEFSVRRRALSLSTEIGPEEFDIQFFPAVEQAILQKFTLSATEDYRYTPVRQSWEIDDWNEWDRFDACTNASYGFDEAVSYTCGAFEIHFSPETYAKQPRDDARLANKAFLIAMSWMVNVAWMWILVHGVDLVTRIDTLLENLDKHH